MSMSKQETAIAGADIVCIGRTGMTPLRFKGTRQILRQYTSDFLSADVALWACASGGYVAHLKLTNSGRKRSYAKRVATTAEALAFLESLPAQMDFAKADKAPNAKRKSIDTMARSLLAQSQTLSAQTTFEQVVEDFSAAMAPSA